jgi:phosphohistidine swiveling domain-containing protein
LKELKPDLFNAKMLKLAGKLVWAKPRRKDYQSKSYYHMEKLQKEIGKRLFLGLEQVRSTPINILKRFLLSGKTQPDIPNQIFNSHICLRAGNNTVSILFGKRAFNFVKKEVVKTRNKNPKNNINISEFIGQVAFPGVAKGPVKVINRMEEVSKMEAGDILVSIATTPSIVPAMKKAAAILTDEGGLTCHASIVSREMEIPCIVGLKIISKTLKDGDMVEVDANKGVVKKLL